MVASPLTGHVVDGGGRVELVAHRKQQGQAGADAPAPVELALDRDIDEVIDVLDLVMSQLALFLLHGADEVAEGRLEAVADTHRPLFRMAVLLNAAGIGCQHAKPGRALTSGHSTLTGGGRSDQKSTAIAGGG